MVTPQVTGIYIAFLDALKIPRHASPNIHPFSYLFLLPSQFPLPTFWSLSSFLQQWLALSLSSPRFPFWNLLPLLWRNLKEFVPTWMNTTWSNPIWMTPQPRSTLPITLLSRFLWINKHSLLTKFLPFLFFLSFVVFLQLPFYDLGQFFFFMDADMPWIKDKRVVLFALVKGFPYVWGEIEDPYGFRSCVDILLMKILAIIRVFCVDWKGVSWCWIFVWLEKVTVGGFRFYLQVVTLPYVFRWTEKTF